MASIWPGRKAESWFMPARWTKASTLHQPRICNPSEAADPQHTALCKEDCASGILARALAVGGDRIPRKVGGGETTACLLQGFPG